MLTDEANAANRIKQDVPVMVVLGNPPYSGEIQNSGKWLNELMNYYKKEYSGIKLLLKRWINGTHQGKMTLKYLEYYLDEFSFRFNRKMSTYRGKLFYRLMQQAVTTPPITNKLLTIK